MLTVISKVELSPFVKVIVLPEPVLDIEALVTKLPVLVEPLPDIPVKFLPSPTNEPLNIVAEAVPSTSKLFIKV